MTGRPDVVLAAEIDEAFVFSEPFIGWLEEPLREGGLIDGPLRPPHPQLLGVAALAAWLRREGFSVSVHDNLFTNPGSKKAFLEALESGPLAVGLSTAMMVSQRSVERVAGWVRRSAPRSLFVLGGRSAQRHAGIRALADATLVGRGEKTMASLLSSLKGGTDWRKTANLCYREGCREVWTAAEEDPDLDGLPDPAWDLLAPGSCLCYPVQASAGCRYSCAFCCVPDRGRQRMRSIPLATGEMRRAFSAHGARLFRIVDSNFTSWPEHVVEFCRALTREKLPVEWSCFGRADDFARHPPLAAAMKGAGCGWVYLGLESGSDAILRSMRKACGRADMVRGVRLAREAGLKVYGNFIIGFPGETRATVDETLDMVKECGPDLVGFFPLRFAEGPDSTLWKERERFGLSGAWRRWSHASMDSATALAQARRYWRAVAESGGPTLLGHESWVTHYLKGGGLSEGESLSFLAGLRDFHRARFRPDREAAASSLGRLAASMGRLVSFWRSRGWRGLQA